MSKEIIIIDNLRDSLETLIEGYQKFQKIEDIELKLLLEDGCIQRFEYTLEAAWKIMRKFLKVKYGKSNEELTINNIFRLMDSLGFIANWENWRNYYRKRNESSHEYSIIKSREVIVLIADFIKDTEILVKNLEKNL
jgi:nucleotidyltransferase substrate binding protein (TIGR01987 family)